MTLPSHFVISEWVDFVRGSCDSTRAILMRQHLSSGCMQCNGVVRVMSGFAKRASMHAAVEPPVRVVLQAEAIFPRQPPTKSILARLVYDSFRQPLPAGIRADEQLARHVRYEADNVVVELQLEQERGSAVVSLVGQVSDGAGSRLATRLPVLLMASKGLVASAVCNALGEFEMDYKASRDLRMYVPLGESGAHLEVRMDELVLPRSAQRLHLGVSSIANSKKVGGRTRGSRTKF